MMPHQEAQQKLLALKAIKVEHKETQDRESQLIFVFYLTGSSCYKYISLLMKSLSLTKDRKNLEVELANAATQPADPCIKNCSTRTCALYI